MIAVAGPTSVSVEMTLPNSPPAHQRWLAHSYTPAKYLGAWEQTLHVYAGAFPNQCIAVVAPNLPILGLRTRNRDRRQAHLRTKYEIVDRAMRVLGTLQFNQAIFMPAMPRSKRTMKLISSRATADGLSPALKCVAVLKAPSPPK
jgi:hypothetical protein